MVESRLYNAVQVQDRRRHIRLREHVVDLPPVVRLVVEKMRCQEVDGIDVDLTLVVDVPEPPAQELFVQTGCQGLYALVFGSPDPA